MTAMRLTASEFYAYYRPSVCGLRVYLKERGEPKAEDGPYVAVLKRLGERHERAHLATLPGAVDLGELRDEELFRRTREEIEAGTPVIYQGGLRAAALIDGVECEVVGLPDFLIREGDGYVIRDSKLTRRVEKSHPEIHCQLQTYGWLYQQNLGVPPASLQVHAGTGEIVDLEYAGAEAVLEMFEELLALKSADGEPYEPVGWSKCGACGYRERCWPAAEARRDVALVAGVDQGLSRALRDEGVESYDQLLERFAEPSLAAVEYAQGKRTRRVGDKAAGRALTMARAMAEGRDIVLSPPAVPQSPNYVMFDLEGLPPQLDELEKIYLWGLQVFGEEGGEFECAVAGFEPVGDREGWEEFLDIAGAILARHGDIPFVHWATYERTKLDMYVERYGDRDGIAGRVRANLLDLHPIVESSIALPLPSYSLKVVEKHVGYERTLEDVAGDWAMAAYIEATEKGEPVRSELMTRIKDYNREDLEATWAVLQWLRQIAAGDGDSG
jgi:predicted RecB family nuclease